MSQQSLTDDPMRSYVEVEQGPDPVAWWLKVAILIMIATALTGVLYALLVGVINPQTPRTLFEARLVTLRNVVETVPESGKARRDYVQALLANDRRSDALAQAELAKKQLKDLDIVFGELAEIDVYWQDKDYDRVVELASAAYANETKRREEYVAKRQKEVNIKNIDIPVQPLVDLLVYEARAAAAGGDFDRAAKSLTAALKLDPQAADLLVLRGTAYRELGQADKARADYEQALEFIPDFQPALDGLEQLGK